MKRKGFTSFRYWVAALLVGSFLIIGITSLYYFLRLPQCSWIDGPYSCTLWEFIFSPAGAFVTVYLVPLVAGCLLVGAGSVAWEHAKLRQQIWMRLLKGIAVVLLFFGGFLITLAAMLAFSALSFQTIV